jgi:hypothetical protein
MTEIADVAVTAWRSLHMWWSRHGKALLETQPVPRLQLDFWFKLQTLKNNLFML